MPKGEKLIGLKQKHHTITIFKNCFTKGRKYAKTLLTAKGRTSSGGAFI
jgi:hypothetical protein